MQGYVSPSPAQKWKHHGPASLESEVPPRLRKIAMDGRWRDVAAIQLSRVSKRQADAPSTTPMKASDTAIVSPQDTRGGLSYPCFFS
jgi:hypothetical protein